MNERQKEILKILLTESGKPLFVQDIAEQVNFSEKTIRNDFKTIETFLKDYTSAAFIRKPGLGVYIEIDDLEKAKLFQTLQLKSSKTQNEEDSIRLLHITYELIMSKVPITAQELATTHYVNKSVIKKDLEHIEKWLTNKDLQLISKQKIGLSIEGTELNKRRALANLSSHYKDSTTAWEFLLKKFSPYEIEIVQSELKDFQRHHSLFFTDETTERLLTHILLMIRRTKLGQPISLPEADISIIKDKVEFKWAYQFLKKLEIVFVIHFSEEEISYFTLHLLGGRFRLQQNQGISEILDGSEGDAQLSSIVEELIFQMTESTKINFKNDNSLKEGLHIHLYSALNRLKYGLTVSNPMLYEIKKMYPYVFDLVIHVLEQINKSFSISIPEEEAAYLTIHFQASIERIRQYKGKRQKAIIVCHMGIGMSQLLSAKIEQRIQSINIIGCIAKADLRDYLIAHKVDMIISTIDLPDIMVPHIVISPLLEEAEEKKLKTFIAQQTNSAGAKQKNFILQQFLNPSILFLNQSFDHRFKIIEQLAKSLYEGGFVENTYGHSAIIRERMSATTIGSGIAIPHGSPKLIKKPAIAAATLKHPIDWGVENVSLVFMLAVPNQDQQATKQLFRELSSISEKPALIKKLIGANSVDQFLSLLNK
jgi:activator of the mannose operon (transcriptional antiterminator)